MMLFRGLCTWTIRVLAASTLALFSATGATLVGQAALTTLPTAAPIAQVATTQSQAEAIILAPSQTISATLIKGVGLTPTDACQANAIRTEISAGTTVYYCYRLTNTGTTAFEPLVDGLIDGIAENGSGGEAITWTPPSSDYLLTPGATLEPTLANGLIREVPGSLVDVTARARWTLDPNTGTGVTETASNFTTVDVAILHTQVLLTVSNSTPSTCATTTLTTLTSYASPAYYCVTIINNSQVSLTSHLITIPALNLNDVLWQGEVGPSSRLSIPASSLSQLAQRLSAPTVTSSATVTSRNSGGNLSTTALSDQVVVSGPGPAITVFKSLNTDPSSCSSVNSLSNVTSGQLIYYCLTVTNSNSFTFTLHEFSEGALGISGAFWYELPPGGRLVLTNSTLPTYGVAPVLGPIEARTSINNTMNYTATNPTFNYRAAAVANASVIVIPASATPTDEPTPTFTPIPGPSPTPTWTPVPIPPTPTFPPTPTPIPTPTTTPTVFVISTPGGLAPTPYPPLIPVAPAAQAGQFVSPLDPIAAATATAAAVFGFPTPILDPFAATATAAAAFAFPTPILDPFAATATAAAIFGFPTPILDPFAATATAAAAFAFPTPILDPAGATATAAAVFGFPTPILDPAGATATAAVQMGFIPPAGATVDPIGATVTAAILTAVSQPVAPQTVITVTATPTPAPTETPTVRPIALPTSPPPSDGTSFFMTVLSSAGATLTLVWFLAGSILFFVTAGVLAGLSFRARERNRYTLIDDLDSSYHVETPVAGSPPAADENWPASLP